MERKAIASCLETAVVKTFEDMAFLDVSEISGFTDSIEFSHILYITFFEPGAGALALFFPYACKKMIAQNIYGTAFEKLRPYEIDDCLLELLNILTGNFLTNCYGTDVKHNTSFPTILFNEKEIENIEGYMDFYFDAEGEPFKVLIYMKRGL